MPRGINIKKHTFLSDNECRLIHAGSCRLLNELGVKVESEQAANIFIKGGASYENSRIKIPGHIVDQAIDHTARRIELGAINPANQLVIDFDSPKIYFGTGGQALNVLHYEMNEFIKRPAVTRDLINILRICEQLDNVDFITRPVEPDVNEREMDLEKTRIFMKYATRHINLANLIKLEKLQEIISAFKDKSHISFISCVAVSPMNLVSPTIEKFMKIVEEDIPVAISSCPQAGTTAPLSEIGELIQVNAEVLSAVVLANLTRPGAKLFYRGIPISSDLYSDGSPRWCQPESIRRIGLVSDMTYFYQIPCCGTAAVSDEKEPNPQNVAEKTLSWVFEAASGAQFINSALGMLEKVLTVCPEQYIIDDKIISDIKMLFEKSPDYNIRELALTAVKDALNMFDFVMNTEMEQDISDRIEFILNGKEELTQDNINSQVELIGNAVSSGKSSIKFMKVARSGMRKGWLYNGLRIEGKLNLEEVHHYKNQLLNSYLQ